MFNESVNLTLIFINIYYINEIMYIQSKEPILLSEDTLAIGLEDLEFTISSKRIEDGIHEIQSYGVL